MYRSIPQAPAPDCPIVQFASGHVNARSAAGGRFNKLVGFYSEFGKCLDFDDHARAAGVAPIEIRHAGGNVVTHWSLGEQLWFYPLTAGPPATTIAACLSSRFKSATAEAGIGLAWPAGEKSRMAVRGYLNLAGAAVLVQLSVSSTMTGHLLTALCDHIRVCVAADQLLADAGKTLEVLPIDLALVLSAGEEIAAGRGAEQAMIAPIVSAHPAEISSKYLNSIWRPKAIRAAADQEWEPTVAWALGYGSGETNGDSHLEQHDDEDVIEGLRRFT